MWGTRLEWKPCAQTPLSAVAGSKGGNVSTGTSQFRCFTFQLTTYIYFLKEDYYV